MLTMKPTDVKPLEAKRKVFVVDDHPILRQGLALLINRSGYDGVRRGRGGATAMQPIAQQSPDIVILDISLNGPDGLDLLKTSARFRSGSAGADSLHAR